MIGDRIRQRREELGLSATELAKMVGVGKSTISNYESNRSAPNETTLFKLFVALKCDANYLYSDYIEDIVASKKVTQALVTKEELQVITEYRKKPNMQNAVKTLLGLVDSQGSADNH